MDFTWNDFLELANEWQGNAVNSKRPLSLYRSIASRAYYAVFHQAFALAKESGLQSTTSASDHFHLRKFFENRGRNARQLSLHLRDLYDLRIDADYSLTAIAFSPEKAAASAQRSIEKAARAMAMIEHLRAR